MSVSAQDRLVSLDAFRGMTIVAMVLVNNPGDWGHLYPPLAHARWNGCTPTDLIFPFFLFIVGVSMVLSLQHRPAQARVATLLTLWRRAGVIVLLGLGLNLVPSFDLGTLRWPGVLQRIGLCIAVAAPLVLWGGWRSWAVAVVLALAVHLAVLFGWPVVGADGVRAAGRLEPGLDAGAALDRWLMAGHLWSASRTWDPEGLLGTLPATATLLIGALTGQALLRPGPLPPKTASMALAGALTTLAGVGLDAWLIPLNKSLWTASYVVFTGGLALLVFAACHGLLDALGSARSRSFWRRACLPFTIHGMNALFLFVVSGLLARLLLVVRVPVVPGSLMAGGGPAPAGSSVSPVSLKAWLAAWPKAAIASSELASLVYALGFVAVMGVLATVMWRRRWFIKV